jgi:CBS domain-containing protein
MQPIPGAHFSPGAFALVAMAATFGASTRAMFASIIFLFELTRDYNSILPLMLATALAVLVASLLTHESIMTEKLTRRGLRVPADYHVDALRTTEVRAVMTTDVETMPDDTAVTDVAKRFQVKGHSAFPVVDGAGRCVGIVTRHDLLDAGTWSEEDAVTSVMAADVVSVRPTDSVNDALDLMVREEVEHLPVIDGDQLVGICTRTDVLRARAAHNANEHPEPGWRPRRRTGR